MNEADAKLDRQRLSEFFLSRGLSVPTASEKHFRVAFDDFVLRWEQHSEFTTYTWEIPHDTTGAPFHTRASFPSSVRRLPSAGELLVAIDLEVVNSADGSPWERLFDRSSLAGAAAEDGTAIYATDFRVTSEGFVRVLVLNQSLDGDSAGALVQRLLEIETYRTLALLGLPTAHRILPSISAIERRLAELTTAMRDKHDLDSNRRLLDELTTLAADLEAGAAASAFRFGATRAYYKIVEQRLRTVGETRLPGVSPWSSFLARRMGPAVRTCAATELRQSTLSLKLSRAADLLRTRVDVELQKQNQELLKSMNARTRMQLRLQTTVKGLSVTAITYYVVGLFGYLVKAAHKIGQAWIEPTYATAGFIPVASLLIWLTVRRIRRHHVQEE